MDWSKLTDAWQGEITAVIGGGASLRGLDWELIENLFERRIIAINKAAFDVRHAFSFSADARFWRHYAPEWERRFGGGPTLTMPVWARCGPEDDPAIPDWVLRLPTGAATAWARSFAEPIGHGHHSGYAALNFADCLGGETIYLLGFDYHGSGGLQTWYHDGYPWGAAEARAIYTAGAAAFEHARPRNRVINASPGSELPWFPRAPLGWRSPPPTPAGAPTILQTAKRITVTGAVHVYLGPENRIFRDIMRRADRFRAYDIRVTLRSLPAAMMVEYFRRVYPHREIRCAATGKVLCPGSTPP